MSWQTFPDSVLESGDLHMTYTLTIASMSGEAHASIYLPILLRQ